MSSDSKKNLIGLFETQGLIAESTEAVTTESLSQSEWNAPSAGIGLANFPIKLGGRTYADVKPILYGYGFIHVENNGGHVEVTQRGTGTVSIVNNGGKICAMNEGNGLMTIDNVASGDLSVIKVGNGRTTVKATGFAPLSLAHSGDEDFKYP